MVTSSIPRMSDRVEKELDLRSDKRMKRNKRLSKGFHIILENGVIFLKDVITNFIFIAFKFNAEGKY